MTPDEERVVGVLEPPFVTEPETERTGLLSGDLLFEAGDEAAVDGGD